MSSVWLVAVVAGASGAYVLAWRQLRRRAAPGASRARLVLWLAGMAVTAIALVGPLDDLARKLMSAHMVQHLLLISAAPALLLPAVLALRGPRETVKPMPVGVAAGCLAASITLIWLLHVPTLLEAGLREPAVGGLQHLALLAAGCLLTWPLIGSDRVPGLAAVFFLVAAEIGLGALGIVLAFSPEVLYGFYEEVPRTFGLSVEDDQALAGALLLVVEEPFLAIEFAALFIGGVLSQTGDEDDSAA